VLQLAAGRLELREPVVDGLIPSPAGLVEVGEATLPLRLVVVEPTAELEFGLLDLIQDHLELGIHSTKGSS
jgi:hypothetical protein